MQRILHVSKYYFPVAGGIEIVARDCVNAYKGKYRQKVICFNEGKGDRTDYIDDTEIIRCGCLGELRSQPISISITRAIREIMNVWKPNYIFVHCPNPYVVHFVLKYIRKSKLIIYWHSDIVKQKMLGKVFYFQNRKLLDRAFKVIVTSPSYIEGSKSLVSVQNKCVIIPNCINEKRLAIDDKITKQAKIIKQQNRGKIICLSVGRHVKYKGLEYLIETSKMVDNRFVFFIAGEGPLTGKLKQLAGDNVHFLGLIDDNYLKAYLLATDIFCFPSITRNEAFGVALAEAMYFGKASVTFHIPGSGVNYVSLNKITGIEVENRNIQAYAKSLMYLADHPEKRVIYGENARKRVESNFMYKQFAQSMLNLVEKMDKTN